jgi:hypothetical protein
MNIINYNNDENKSLIYITIFFGLVGAFLYTVCFDIGAVIPGTDEMWWITFSYKIGHIVIAFVAVAIVGFFIGILYNIRRKTNND